MGTMMAALVRDQAGVTLRSMPVPEPSPDEVRVRVAWAGVCRTDVAVAWGKIPVAWPRILGHEFSGVIERVGAGVEGLSSGQRVAVMPVVWCGVCPSCVGGHTSRCQSPSMLGVELDGAFAQQVCIPARAVFPLSEAISMREGAYAEPVAASMAALKAPIRADQRGLIYGQGRIAELTARVLQAHGFERLVIGGAELCRQEGDHAFDFAIETVATTEALDHLVRALRPGGCLVLKSRRRDPAGLSVGLAVQKELTLQAVHYAPFEDALALLASGRMPVDDLLGGGSPLASWEEVFAQEEDGEPRKQFLLLDGGLG